MSGGWAGSRRRRELPANWNAISHAVIRDEPVCYVCHLNASVQADHVVPGGDHSRGNLRGICVPCHKAKSAREGNAARTPQEREQRAGEGHPGFA